MQSSLPAPAIQAVHTTALAPVQERMSFAEVMEIAEVMHKSGFFKDCPSPAHVATKILAGQEMGIGPWASLTGIHMIPGGGPRLDAKLIAAKVQESGRFSYRILKHDATVCEIEFYEAGNAVGRSTFTIEMARKAKLADKDNWKNYPENMLFARAMTNGAKWYCPMVSAGISLADEDGEPPAQYTRPPQTQPPAQLPPKPTEAQPVTQLDKFNQMRRFCQEKFLPADAPAGKKAILDQRINLAFADLCEMNGANSENINAIPEEAFQTVMAKLRETIAPLSDLPQADIIIETFPTQAPHTKL